MRDPADSRPDRPAAPLRSTVDPDSSNSSALGRRGFLLSALSALGAASCVNQPIVKPTAPPVPGIADLFAEQGKLYPLMEAEDIYKLLYQATMGPSAFFIGGESSVVRGLATEIKQITPPLHDGEEEFELLCRERGLVRVNLRPYLKNGGKAEELAHALCLTTHNYRGELAELEASIDWVSAQLDQLGLAADKKDWQEISSAMRRRKFPPGLHSEAYAITYRPAYRIVQIEFLTDPQYGGRGDLYTSRG